MESVFILTDHGSIVLLQPRTPAGHESVETRIGEDNGYQPYWPTVLIEARYAAAILHGLDADGLRVGA